MRTVVLASVLAGLLLLAALPASASAGLVGWQYQREIAIQENSGETLRDYPVLVALAGSDFPGEAQPDGDDIRFTDADGRELRYWIEEFDAGSNRAMIWVKVPLIPANREAGITMWYGNPGAASESDGEAVFEFFDDFGGIHSLRDYIIVDLGTKHAPSNWVLDAVNKKIIQKSNIHGYGGERFGSVLLTGVNLANFEIRVKTKEVDNDIMGLLFSYQTSSQFYHYSYSNDYAGTRVGATTECTRGKHRWVGKDNTGICTSNLASDNNPPGTASIVEIKIRRCGSAIKVFQDGVEILSAEESAYGTGDIGLMTDGIGDKGDGEFYPPFIIRSYTSPEPTITLAPPAPATHTALAITKSPTPHSIRQFQETTITIAIENSGTTDATDIEITDAIHPSFDLTSGDFPNPKRYDLIRPGETRDLQYTITAKESGTFTLDPATVTYADEDGNIQEAKSEPVSIKVIPSTEGSTAGGTSRSNPYVSTASVQLHGEKTDVVLGEDILLKLSAVNLITKPAMHVQVIIIPPSGMSVASSAFAKSGAGQYTTTYELEPGSGKDIEVAIRSNQVGEFDVNGRIIYYFGDDRDDAEDHTLTLPITVRAEAEAGAERAAGTSESEEKGSSTPGFAAVVAVMGLLAVYLRRKGR
jgi:hypothetical protein